MNILYLRTLYCFNLKAGGSVTHTSGVINSFGNDLSIEIVSNDRLEGVKKKINIISPIRFSFLPNFLNELLYNLKVIKNTQKTINNYHFIYQRHSGCSFEGAFLSQQRKIPFILEYNSSEVWKLKNWTNTKHGITFILDRIQYFIKLPLYSFIEKYNLSKADLIVVVSIPLKEALIVKGIPPQKILVNPNGIDPAKYSPDIAGNHVRKKYHLNKKTIVGFIGTFGQWHGAEVLAEACGLLLDSYPEYKKSIHLLLIGDGLTMPIVKERLTKWNIFEFCTLTGTINQDKGPEYMAACDILVSPHVPNPDGTAFFGSPTKLFEYMAMGKGIVASRLDQINDILEHNQTAIMVNPGCPKSLMKGIKILIDNPYHREKLGKAAREKVIQKYTWKHHTNNIINKVKERCLI